MRSIKLTLVLVLTCLTLISCVRIYKMDVQQGNDLTDKQISEVIVGMSRDQIRTLLGTPLIDDPFHGDRWDYFYAYKASKSSKTNRRQFSLFFKDDILQTIEGGPDTETVAYKPLDLEKLDHGLSEEPEEKTGFWASLRSKGKKAKNQE
jgi:outer membrane protein assembly factor BamE (lipoprotein component of BamABCDE complex)